MGHIWEGDGNKLPNITGLASANAGLDGALNTVEGGDRTVPSQVLTLYHQSERETSEQIAAWAAAKRVKLTVLNDALQRDGLPPVSISEIEEEVQELKTR